MASAARGCRPYPRWPRVQLVRDSASRLLEKEALDIEHLIRRLQLEMARQTAEILRLEQVVGRRKGAPSFAGAAAAAAKTMAWALWNWRGHEEGSRMLAAKLPS